MDNSASRFDFKGIVDILQAFAAVVAAASILATFGWQISHHFAMPVYDDIFDRLRFYRYQTSIENFLQYFILPHNEHRIATTRIVAALDETFFNGREYLQVVASNSLQFISACIAYKTIEYKSSNLSPIQHFFVFVSICILCINPNFFYTLVVPFQLQHAIMEFLVVIAAALAAHVSGPEPRASSQIRCILWLLLIAAIATFTLGNAPVILIAAAGMAIVLRWKLSFILGLAALAIAHTALVLATTTGVGTDHANIFEIFKFALVYWGSPFLRFDPWPATYVTWWSSEALAYVFGSVVFTTGIVFGILRLFKPGLGGRAAAFGLMILIVVVVTGFAAGHSRAQFGVLEASNKKYASFAALGWLGVLAIASGIARQNLLLHKWRGAEAVSALALALMIPLTIIGYARETRIWQRMIDRNWEAATAVFSHANANAALRDLYTDDKELASYLAIIEPKHRGAFSYFPFHWGDDIKSLHLTEMVCRSKVETLAPIQAVDLANVFHDAGKAMTMSGWTWMSYDRAPPGMVIAVDQDDRIAGAAFVTRTGEQTEDWLGQKFDQNLGWFGYARVMDGSKIRFYALTRDGRHFCSLGGVEDAK